MSFKVHLKNGYSDRKGITKYKDIIQFESLDERTRNKIYSFICDYIKQIGVSFGARKWLGNKVDGYNSLIEYLYTEVYSLAIDEVPIERSPYRTVFVNISKVLEGVKEIVLNSIYEEVFTFIEAIEKFVVKYNRTISSEINEIFEAECVQHRMVNGLITDITSDIEIEEVEQALKQNEVCAQHFSKAINYLYDKQKPDYENSVKESISAIEAMCNLMLGKQGASLGEALKRLEENNIKIHGALKSAYEKIYGYTSDEPGIRHSNGLSLNTTFEEAKYMLVSCSAFLNYLVGVFEKTK